MEKNEVTLFSLLFEYQSNRFNNVPSNSEASVIHKIKDVLAKNPDAISKEDDHLRKTPLAFAVLNNFPEIAAFLIKQPKCDQNPVIYRMTIGNVVQDIYLFEFLKNQTGSEYDALKNEIVKALFPEINISPSELFQSPEENFLNFINVKKITEEYECLLNEIKCVDEALFQVKSSQCYNQKKVSDLESNLELLNQRIKEWQEARDYLVEDVQKNAKKSLDDKQSSTHIDDPVIEPLQQASQSQNHQV